jgi:hypothetical protein
VFGRLSSYCFQKWLGRCDATAVPNFRCVKFCCRLSGAIS